MSLFFIEKKEVSSFQHKTYSLTKLVKILILACLLSEITALSLR